MIISVVDEHGVAEITVDNPPVNALPVRGWFALADALTAATSRPSFAERARGVARRLADEDGAGAVIEQLDLTTR